MDDQRSAPPPTTTTQNTPNAAVDALEKPRKTPNWGDKQAPPWQKGQSGNPNGRPKDESLTRRMRELLKKGPGRAVLELVYGKRALARMTPEELDGQTNAQALAMKLFLIAVSDRPNNLEAARMIWHYVDGKPRESVEISVDQQVTVTIADIRRAVGILPEPEVVEAQVTAVETPMFSLESEPPIPDDEPPDGP